MTQQMVFPPDLDGEIYPVDIPYGWGVSRLSNILGVSKLHRDPKGSKQKLEGGS